MRRHAQSDSSHAGRVARLLLIATLALLVALSGAAQQSAVREDGTTVLLHPDGRWEVAPALTPAAASGSGARTGTGFMRWTADFRWCSSDPGQLLDNNGALKAESP